LIRIRITKTIITTMAHFNARQMKIRILCDRAEKEEIEKEKLEEQGLSEKEIEETIKMRKTQTFHNTGQTLPFDEKEQVIKTLHATNLGLPGTHLIKSSTKAMMDDMERKVAKQKAKKVSSHTTTTTSFEIRWIFRRYDGTHYFITKGGIR